MKVFMLGGYGTVGMPVAKWLAASDLISEITLAGRNQDSASQAASQIGDKARGVQLDAEDEERLSTLAAGNDILVNVVSNQVALPVLQAAARVGAHYCDVGFGLPYIDEMMKFAENAREAGITAIICLGISPCITNLMGVHAASQLDEVEQLIGGRSIAFEFENGINLTPQQWSGDIMENLAELQNDRGFFEWVLDFIMQNESRNIRGFQDGCWIDMNPMREGIKAPIPGRGMETVYPYACTKPWFDTLPYGLGREGPVNIFFVPFPPQLYDFFRKGALDMFAAGDQPQNFLDAFYETVEANPSRWLTLADDSTALPSDWVTVVGRKDGRAASYSCWFVPSTWTKNAGYMLTSAALAAAIIKILRGEIKEKGVMTAESILDPLSFIRETAQLVPELASQGTLIDDSFEWLE